MRDIVKKSFERHFPAWESLSPSDPIRLFADSLQDSLLAIENRQKHLVDSLIDSLPSLVGIEAQAAQLPAGWIAIEPSAKLKTATLLPSGTRFKFATEKGDLHLALLEDFSLVPVSQFRVETEGNTVRLRFVSTEVIDRLRVSFSPHAVAASANLKQSSCPVVSDSTDCFSRAGTLEFHLAGNARGVDLVFDVPVLGDWSINVAFAELQRLEGETRIGVLKGEPWESLVLPDHFVHPPERIILRFPDAQTRELHRGSDELLRLRHTDPETFEGLFFYNGVHHALVVPAAEKWLRGYLGGAVVETYSAVAHTGLDWIPSEANFLNEMPRLIAGVRPLHALRGHLPRETSANYLRRFYATVRAISERKAATEFRPSELCRRIPGICPAVRAAEFEIDEGEIVFHLLLEIGPKGSGDEEKRILGVAWEWLRGQVPLAYGVHVQPFKRTPLVAVSRMPLSPTETAALERAVQPAPFGSAEVRQPVVAHALGLAHWKVGEEGRFTQELQRIPGECFQLQIEGEARHA